MEPHAAPATGAPRHVAIIMDGNGRWAESRGLPRAEGHAAGAKSVRMAVEECRRCGIEYLTLFTFSTENWKRPAAEVAALMHLFQVYLEKEAEELAQHGIRLRAIGDRSRLPASVREGLERAEKRTERGTAMHLVLALSYGGREELLNAARTLAAECAAGTLDPSAITQEVFRGALYAPDIPDPDLLIRTSGESRISNFLLWQLAYTEIAVTEALWPDFSAAEFRRCLEIYAGRHRRFGMTAAQLSEMHTNGTHQNGAHAKGQDGVRAKDTGADDARRTLPVTAPAS